MRRRIVFLAVALAATAILAISAELSSKDWWYCFHDSPNRPPVWKIALDTLTRPSSDALLIAAMVLPSLIAIVLARGSGLQVLQVVPLALLLLLLLADGGHPGHDCDRKGSGLGFGIAVVLLIVQVPIGTLSLLTIAIQPLIALRRRSRAAIP